MTHTEEKPTEFPKIWSWSLWAYELDITQMRKAGVKEVEVMARVITSDGFVQNGKVEDQFNVRGILNTSPHTIKI
jgi:hypothetical protein